MLRLGLLSQVEATVRACDATLRAPMERKQKALLSECYTLSSEAKEAGVIHALRLGS